MAFDTAGAGLVFLLARVLFGAVFAFTGLNHFLDAAGMIGYAQAKGIPMASLGVPASGGMLIAGGVGIALGVYPTVAAGAVAVFLVAAWTGYGLEYVPDRQSEEVARVRISASCSRAGPSERTDRRTPSATNSPPSSQATRTVSHRFGSAIRSSRLPTPTGDSATDSFASASPSSTPTTRRAAPNCLASSTASRSRCDQRNSSWSLRPQGASVASE